MPFVCHPFTCETCCGRIPQRYVLALMLHLAFQNAYCMRIVLNVAIVEMVEPDAKRNASEQACPEYDTMSVDREHHKFDWPHSAKTRILYSFFIGYTLTCFPGGWLADRYGGRYVLGGTVLFSSIINVAFPYLTKKGGHMMAVVLRGLLGIVQGPILPAISSFMSNWSPPDERRILGGISYGGSNLGTILGSLFTGIVIEKFKGWPAAFYFWSSFSLGYILLHTIYVFSWPFTHPYMSEEELDYLNKSIVPKRVFKTPWKAILRNVPFWANVCGQFGHNYIFFIMVTWLPTYMKEVLRYDIAENGLLSALPFIALWVSSLILSFTGNYILSTLHWMPTLTFNKLFGSFSNIVCSALVLAAVYVGCNRTWCITLYIIGMILKAFYYITFPVNINELSKHYGGIMFGICNTIGSGSGLMGTVIVGSLTKHNKLSEWKIAFWITFIIEVISSTIFCLWASSDRQAFDYEVEEPDPE